MTIAAISTPLSVGGISVIRISGKDAKAVAKKVFRPVGTKDIEKMAGYTCTLGDVIENDQPIDQALLTVFNAPKSYTGEDVVEISCHGGVYITTKILRIILDNGARLAQPGEFTKRAFLNGKLTLTQAESVIDLIHSQGEQSARLAKNNVDGVLYREIDDITHKLLGVAAHLNAWVDYPEDDVPMLDSGETMSDLKNAYLRIEKLLQSFEVGKIFHEGVTTAIVGKPNVGKSTLMNLLAGWNKSIVTEIAGTTRDIVEESVNLGKVVLRLSDTAGIRQTDDVVESIGVDMAKKQIERAQLVLSVFDGSQKLCDDDFSLIDSLDKNIAIAVINKNDLQSQIDEEYISTHFKYTVKISAKQNLGKDELINSVENVLGIIDVDTSAPMIVNERQRACAYRAKTQLTEAIDTLEGGYTLDAVTVALETAIESLLELTGQRVTNAVVDEVFSRFCVGK
ncbi:MAG: tRNA uridine-5-carboxymethylaminomethyl(34) synthesis GTPase MnmE, partial [Oscillospiraceae bacterium]|nr:tRNA uridine-5-carboxymethylaminomethyl(34) synthesis GTPase MnmE [Oscillospiraceae bacterium]